MRAFKIILIVVLLDFITKHQLTTLGPLEHSRNNLIGSICITFGALILLLFRKSKRVQVGVLPVSIFVGGLLANGIDIGLDGTGGNPFITVFNGKAIGFNLADVALVVGSMMMMRDIYVNYRNRGNTGSQH